MGNTINLTVGGCMDYASIVNDGGLVVENSSGSVSVYKYNSNIDALAPVILSKSCCEFIKPSYTFDIDSQTCRWIPDSGCSLSNSFKLVLNSNGDDGSLFYVDNNDNCSLSIDFDYLFKIKCENLVNTLTFTTPVSVFETFDVSVTVDIVTSANTLQTVYEESLLPAIGQGNLYSYITTNTNTGFYVCGDPSVSEPTFSACTLLSLNTTGITQSNVYSCDSIMNNIINELFIESGLSGTSGGTSVFNNSLTSTAFASNWLHYQTLITDPIVLSAIANQKIKLTIKVNYAASDFCVLIDEIVLDKVCTQTNIKTTFLNQSPGFELDRIRDNKKSWIANNTLTNRPFVISNNIGGNSIRQTNYDVNDERLVINSKEIDLDISLASAIETDVWCYLIDNPCLLTGITSCNPCEDICGNKTFQDEQCYDFMDNEVYEFMDGTFSGTNLNLSNCCGDNMIDFNELLTQQLSAITTVEDFGYFMTSELIDVKNRQTISSYPTLKALYNRYINSELYCGSDSSFFNYLTMEQFAKLIGNYWVDIVEQVVPATTIWGSVKVYSNTIFDQQKYKYKKYSSLFCGNPFSGETVLSPINGKLGTCHNVEVIMSSIPVTQGISGLTLSSSISTICGNVCLAQMNSGSEFIGSVNVVGGITMINNENIIQAT